MIFPKKFLPNAPWRVETWEKFQKIKKKIQIFKNVQKRSQKCPDLFWTCLEVTFFENCQLGWLVAKKNSVLLW